MSKEYGSVGVITSFYCALVDDETHLNTERRLNDDHPSEGDEASLLLELANRT